MRRACLAVALLFVASAALQWNDPDPWRWIAIYVAAGAVSGWASWRRIPRSLPVLVALWSGGWMLSLVPAAFADFRIADLARSMKAETPSIELSREWLGLVVIAGWMIVVALTRAGRGPKKNGPGDPGRS